MKLYYDAVTNKQFTSYFTPFLWCNSLFIVEVTKAQTEGEKTPLKQTATRRIKTTTNFLRWKL